MTARVRYGTCVAVGRYSGSGSPQWVDVTVDGQRVRATQLDGISPFPGDTVTLVQDGRRIVAVTTASPPPPPRPYIAHIYSGASGVIDYGPPIVIPEDEIEDGDWLIAFSSLGTLSQAWYNGVSPSTGWSIYQGAGGVYALRQWHTDDPTSYSFQFSTFGDARMYAWATMITLVLVRRAATVEPLNLAGGAALSIGADQSVFANWTWQTDGIYYFGNPTPGAVMGDTSTYPSGWTPWTGVDADRITHGKIFQVRTATTNRTPSAAVDPAGALNLWTAFSFVGTL